MTDRALVARPPHHPRAPQLCTCHSSPAPPGPAPLCHSGTSSQVTTCLVANWIRSGSCLSWLGVDFAICLRHPQCQLCGARVSIVSRAGSLASPWAAANLRVGSP